MCPVDGPVHQVTPKQRSNRAVGDDGKITTRMLRRNSLYSLANARLCVHGRFPSPEAVRRVGKELICRSFELCGRQETGGAAVVFAKGRVDIDR